jgi:CspA family cold shock protein
MQKEPIMAIGTVKFFNTTKGFGFISPEGGGKDVFVHVSAVQAAGMRALNEGQRVSFDIQPVARGSTATNLTPALSRLCFLIDKRPGRRSCPAVSALPGPPKGRAAHLPLKSGSRN